MAVFFVTDGGEVFISATPTTAQWVILALLAVALPLASLVGWLVSQISSGRGQAAVATMAVAFAAASDVIESGPIQLLRTAVVGAWCCCRPAAASGRCLAGRCG